MGMVILKAMSMTLSESSILERDFNGAGQSLLCRCQPTQCQAATAQRTMHRGKQCAQCADQFDIRSHNFDLRGCKAGAKYIYSMNEQELKALGHPEYWNNRYNEADGHEWFRSFKELQPLLVKELPEAGSNPKIIHLGCGDSVSPLRLPGLGTDNADLNDRLFQLISMISDTQISSRLISRTSLSSK